MFSVKKMMNKINTIQKKIIFKKFTSILFHFCVIVNQFRTKPNLFVFYAIQNIKWNKQRRKNAKRPIQ